MKRLLIIFSLLAALACQPLFARHIKGGEISYTYLGPGASPGTDRFEITLRLFLECGASGQQLDPDANIGIFKNGSELAVPGSPFSFPLTGDQFINLTTPNPCITSPSPVCYRLRTYTRTIDLPQDPEGYTMVFQRCCRINGLINLSPNNNVGSSYTCKMGGTNVLGTGTNSSPSFAIKDTVLICQNRPFQLDFSADDIEGDSLSYEFCSAYTATQGGGGGVIDPVNPSRIGFVNYAGGFSGSLPLGPSVTIDHKTGLISGIAPSGGDYVISVCVFEWRDQKVISEHRKDFNIQVDQRCDLAAAVLNPTYTNCDNFFFAFQNESPPSTLIHTYNWDFGVNNLLNDTSSNATPTFTYPDTGVYRIKLIINRGEQCSDSTESDVRVFPGFFTGFTITGSCVQLPYTFTDTTKARYGIVNAWLWNLGDETTAADESTNRTVSWKYATSGQKPIAMIVSTSKGCIDTVFKMLDVRERPIVNLAFKDTLICSIDTLQLKIDGAGVYTWRPNYNIIDPNVPSPFVFPKQTTVYKVDLNDNGCTNTDSVRVRVVDFVTLNAGPDTTICLTDSLVLRPSTDGLQFTWTPANTLSDPTIKNPIAFPTGNTTYRLIARIGKCSTPDDIFVKTVPYPLSNAGKDTVICYDDTATLHGAIIGSSFSWTPAAYLGNARLLTTTAFPPTTSMYTLRVFDTLGCPKPGVSTVKVTVRPKIIAFAGNDTAVVLGQPLQLRGSGADFYLWNPGQYLNNTSLRTPVAMLNDNFTYTMKAFTEEGCFAMDTINIKVFKTAPDIFVPNAFAPAGTNRVLRPIPVGISTLSFFRVYNRYGQLVYQTKEIGRGWDGSLAGKAQPTGTYIWHAAGTDYTGKSIVRQGTAILIR